jgi:hypothetical protein
LTIGRRGFHDHCSPLTDTPDQLIVVLEEHLGVEDEPILPVVRSAVTATEWDQIGKA